MGDLVQMMVSIAGVDLLKQDNVNSLNIDNINLSGLDTVAILKITWVLARTAEGGPATIFPRFEEWLEQNEDLNVLDPVLLGAVMEEVKSCFFRGNKTVAPSAQR